MLKTPITDLIMTQKLVKFEIANALKNAGYPQQNTEFRYVLSNSTFDHLWFTKGELINKSQKMYLTNIADAPTYIDAWLWLWREKNIKIEHIYNFATYIYGFEEEIQLEGCFDPEEAITKAIVYLVENNLIK